ncbi:hypothetical protein [uncultured Paraglaciecola sp.]|uniref:hypothetical protein n=1 Tax=uncultured Paraglaciecola sp. TaxID=1765024 RepID=UPI002598FA7A|nr:hypothetical protein [uncultured Paraglaciecola sp.]
MIQNVLSFMGSWEMLQNKFPEELESLRIAIEQYASGKVVLPDSDGRVSTRELWEKALYDDGWNVMEQTFFTPSGRKLPVRSIGPQKNGLSAQIAFNNPDFLARWLFTYSTLAVRNGVVEIPILVVPMIDSHPEMERNRPYGRMGTFEYYHEQLEMLSPISLTHPFLIIGYSVHATLIDDVGIFELEPEDRPAISEANVVINKSIEFPPEYHQAGLGILNFFSTYLNENYPQQDATVKIEQHGLKVRMVVESGDGNPEIIEKALHEYEQIMSGAENATKFTQNDKLVLELRNEVRAAKFRIESQQDIIALQNHKIKTSESRIDTLLEIVGEGLKKEPQNINVQVNPCIQNNMSVTINSDISSSMGCLEELTDLLPKDDEVCLPIIDLSKSLQTLESEQNPEVVRTSSAMTKFSRFIDRISDRNGAVRKAIDATQQGFEVAQDLVNKYNKIASWCGLPVVPTFK